MTRSLHFWDVILHVVLSLHPTCAQVISQKKEKKKHRKHEQSMKSRKMTTVIMNEWQNQYSKLCLLLFWWQRGGLKILTSLWITSKWSLEKATGWDELSARDRDTFSPVFVLFLPPFGCLLWDKKWARRLVSWAKRRLQLSTGHAKGRSPVCVRMWVRKLNSKEKRFPQPSTWHLNAFSPVWTSWCRFSFEGSVKPFPHWWQMCVRGPCVCKCFRYRAESVNFLRQYYK